MFRERKSFFDRLAGLVNNDDFAEDEADDTDLLAEEEEPDEDSEKSNNESWMEQEANEGELTIDLFQRPSEVVLQTMVAGVKPDDLDISISREMVTIKGKRERSRSISEDNYMYQELYWGSFSRTVMLPEEIDVEAAEATEQNGLLTIRLPKIDKKKTQRLKVRGNK